MQKIASLNFCTPLRPVAKRECKNYFLHVGRRGTVQKIASLNFCTPLRPVAKREYKNYFLQRAALLCPNRKNRIFALRSDGVAKECKNSFLHVGLWNAVGTEKRVPTPRIQTPYRSDAPVSREQISASFVLSCLSLIILTLLIQTLRRSCIKTMWSKNLSPSAERYVTGFYRYGA
ncbi:hypothetical protein [Desulfonema ishimotonii]|uniref:hypothetical protein n=1 Tax=Desulfonema ishimotonii TaxID=45657 RepID=UPI000F5705F7|nr:hypothetical protein [Desulfonema ishimotonii]